MPVNVPDAVVLCTLPRGALLLSAFGMSAHGLTGGFCVGSPPHAVSWLPEEGRGGEVEKETAPEAQ